MSVIKEIFINNVDTNESLVISVDNSTEEYVLRCIADRVNQAYVDGNVAESFRDYLLAYPAEAVVWLEDKFGWYPSERIG